jgi:hypothetical protein
VDVQVMDVLARCATVIPVHVRAHWLECTLDLPLYRLHREEEVPHGRVVEVQEWGAWARGTTRTYPRAAGKTSKKATAPGPS